MVMDFYSWEIWGIFYSCGGKEGVYSLLGGETSNMWFFNFSQLGEDEPILTQFFKRG